MEQKSPLSIKVLCVYLLALIVLNAFTYSQTPLHAYLILIGINAVIIYGLLFRQVWAWFVLLAYTLLSLLNPFPLDIAAGSLVMAFQAFQAGNVTMGKLLLYASIFSLTMLVYAFYGWKTLPSASKKTDTIWALAIGIIFLWNISGFMRLFFNEPLSIDMLWYSILFLGLIALWHFVESKNAILPANKSRKGKQENA